MNCHIELVVGALSLGTSLLDRIISSKDDSHAAMSTYLRLTEYPHLHTGLLKHLVEILHLDATGIALYNNSARCRRAIETDGGDRETEQRTGMKSKLAQILGDHGHHTGIVGTRRHFAEYHLIALHEQLDAEYSISAESIGDLAGYLLPSARNNGSHHQSGYGQWARRTMFRQQNAL